MVEPAFDLKASSTATNFGKFSARFFCSSAIEPESSTTKTISIFVQACEVGAPTVPSDGSSDGASPLPLPLPPLPPTAPVVPVGVPAAPASLKPPGDSPPHAAAATKTKSGRMRRMEGLTLAGRARTLRPRRSASDLNSTDRTISRLLLYSIFPSDPPSTIVVHRSRRNASKKIALKLRGNGRRAIHDS